MIRQAISCDICGSEKRQTNHWFVAYDQGGELRVAGWSSRNRLRPGSKHLCGQTCLHKLVDEFMAKAISGRAQAAPDELEVSDRVADSGSSREVASPGYVAAGPLYDDGESSARLVKPASPSTPTVPAAPRPLPFRAQPELVPPAGRPPAAPEISLPGPYLGPPSGTLGLPAAAQDPAPRFSSRQWRAEAWNRERNRELRNGNPDVTVRRRVGS